MHEQWSPEALRQAGALVTEWIAEFFGTLEQRPITPDVTPAETDALFAGEIPAEGTGFEAAFREVRDRIAANSLLVTHPRYFGLMTPTPVAPALFADAVISALNQNMGAWSHSPAATAVEKRLVRWLCELVGYPQSAFGTFCSGGSVANLIGLRVAIAERLPESREGGLQALERPPVFYASREAHFSLQKAAATLGLGTRALRAVAVDDRARLHLPSLRQALREDRDRGLQPFALVGIAGTTSSGSVDPLAELADVAAEHGLWYHVDAAWGSGALLSSRHRHLLRGIERADSVTFDPHKWFFMPIAAGAILCRHREALLRTFDTQAVYIPTAAEEERTDFRRYGLVGSKRFDALKLWLSLRTLGTRWYEEVIDRHMELTGWLRARLEERPEWEMLVPPDLNILCFRFRPPGVPDAQLPALQDAVVDEVVRRGHSWISATAVNGVKCIRWMALSPALTEAHVREFWEELTACAASALDRAGTG